MSRSPTGKGPGSDEIGARISLKDASQLPKKDASQLPEGAWVGLETGHLYEAEDGQSLTAVVCDDRQEFVLVGTPGRTTFPQMRQRAREYGIEPKF